ncbi:MULTISPECIES: SDR family NAD(P)-dependent oxidoreductase [unclassified Beijerinckia]|uniref:SDR family NAD(P)-dependent oxidoreductase n=1 Tax=unclassified Beijerinckia TaxID=2638183 RepID=UPI00089C1745|nr:MULTISPECIES: SDR family NAD(P)-dependent oxidoreductase [unclassified Beijerinckia]MDH7798884.1 3-oxoacyl-[acyl-carrier protein] reductase [Beijerinckia sp. GAS462]SED88040.1 3-oxoacyl-[acyl-carrier protein] reductase [Beijerinckia sp. 28-YEA-48]
MSEALKGRVALVTGSSRGIGAAVARLFASEGALVALHGRDTEALEAVRRDIHDLGGQAIEVAGDVTDFRAIETMRLRIERELGPVDILVANAGGSFTPPAMIEDIPEDGWRASVEGNLTATFLTLKCFLPSMKARKRGAIVTVSSAAARKPHPRAPIPYAVAKAGIVILTQDVAAQAGPYGIRVNCVAPETILTERNLERIPQAQQEQLRAEHPIQRLGTPEDVAHAILYLTSDAAGWITGVVLDVAGGAVMI